MTQRAAIVGRAATTALGVDLASTWAAFAAGSSAMAPWPSSAGWEGGAPWCARIVDTREGQDEDPTLRMLGRHGEWLDRVARAAHEEAGFRALAREELGLYVALGMVDSPPEELAAAVLASRAEDGSLDLARFYAGGFRAMHPLWPLAMLGNVAAGQVAIGLDIRGDNTVLASDASAGMRVLAEALRALETGVVRAALVGGAAEPVCEASLARRRFAGDLRAPTEKHPDMMHGPGEGAAVLALETPASAAARGARALGWLSGAASAFGGRGTRAKAEACLAALAAGGVAPADLDLVILLTLTLPGAVTIVQGPPAPGTPKLLGALWEAGARPRFVSLGGALGDLLGAGPALGIALALDIFAAGNPPALRTTRLRVGEAAAPPERAPRRALVVTLGADGQAGAVLVEAPSCAS